jgi:hypothetical protein
MADERHPQCVLVAPEMAAARALADWLTEKGFPAEPLMPPAIAATGDSLGLTEEAFTGIEVRVLKAEDAEPAKQAVAEMRDEVAAVRDRQKQRAERTGTVTAVCEDCGKPSDWPASAMGTTETCPHCSSFMDVPDPDENWDDVDFSGDDGDNGANNS